jgi:phage terminase large subunit GpA-like protein
MRFPKHEYIRSKELLRVARQIPCQHCGADDGTIVAAHTNWQGGKGRGIKADDNLIASLCYRCHSEIDQGSKLDKSQRQAIWANAHDKTVKKLMSLGLWPIDVPVPDLRKSN